MGLEKLGDEGTRCASLVQTAVDYRCRGQLVASESTFRLALVLQPTLLEAQIGLATVLFRQNRMHEAEEWTAGALLHPSARPPQECSFALPLQESLLVAAMDLVEQLRRYELGSQADTLLEQILVLDPDNLALHRQFGMLLLRCGEFRYGWRERDKRTGPFAQPVWRGEPLFGKTILVQALHGFGDTIQFVRLLPLLKTRGARVILEHQPALATLLQGTEGWDRLLARHTGREGWEIEFDFHIPLMSLPDPLGIEGKIPAAIPYLRPDPDRVRAWQERLGAPHTLRVGLVWAGNPEFKGDRERSCRLTDYAWLAQLPGVQFFSLQKGEAAQQATSTVACKMRLTDLEPLLTDWADTAAAILQLDLVITVDTAVAHLAGALGRPVWVLLPHHSCWRWMERRNDSPWYPTMRLFRQSSAGDWSDVLQHLIRELHDLTAY